MSKLSTSPYAGSVLWDGEDYQCEWPIPHPITPPKNYTVYHVVNGIMLGATDTNNARIDYLVDVLGSVTGQTDSTGASVGTYRWKPYGSSLSTSGVASGKYGWTGNTGSRAIGLSFTEQYNRNRYFSTTTKQWTTRDMLWPNQLPYNYVGSNPASYLDRTGKKRSIPGWHPPMSPGDPPPRLRLPWEPEPPTPPYTGPWPPPGYGYPVPPVIVQPGTPQVYYDCSDESSPTLSQVSNPLMLACTTILTCLSDADCKSLFSSCLTDHGWSSSDAESSLGCLSRACNGTNPVHVSCGGCLCLPKSCAYSFSSAVLQSCRIHICPHGADSNSTCGSLETTYLHELLHCCGAGKGDPDQAEWAECYDRIYFYLKHNKKVSL